MIPFILHGSEPVRGIRRGLQQTQRCKGEHATWSLRCFVHSGMPAGSFLHSLSVLELLKVRTLKLLNRLLAVTSVSVLKTHPGFFIEASRGGWSRWFRAR